MSIAKETNKTTPADGRFLADELFTRGYVVDARKVRSLSDQVEALTKERDDLREKWKQFEEYDCDELKAAYALVDAIKAERDELRSILNAAAISAIRQERQIIEYEAAAKLALDALVAESRTTESNVTLAQILTAITALRQAGVQ